MNVNEIEKQGFILALFIRDDKKRFLLGSGAYEFKESQLHFSANTMSNDVVEVQGNDGCLLAGQVRRPTTQVFDGYIGDATVNRSEIESYRKDFFAFFQKNHFYTVVYVFPDGSTIQRRRGFIVDCGEVKELYQIFPTYHIGVNFEDVNYYKYSENDLGEETYGKLADIGLSVAVAGGLVWEDSQSGTETKTGVNIAFDNSIAGSFEDLRINGDTTQQTYTGKNLLNVAGASDNSAWVKNNNGGFTFTKNSSSDRFSPTLDVSIPANTNVTISYDADPNSTAVTMFCQWKTSGGSTIWTPNIDRDRAGGTITTAFSQDIIGVQFYFQDAQANGTHMTIENFQIELGSSKTSYEPYVGGTASPNPSFPQTVHTVSGEQTITISDGNSQSQSYTVDLGSIELCKIGTYQDYIYKSGDDWYVHKAVDKVVFDGSEDWARNSYEGTYYYRLTSIVIPAQTSGYSNDFAIVPSSAGIISQRNAIRVQDNQIDLIKDGSNVSLADFKTWLGSHNTSVYYALATATDTKITDNTLIGQLEAVLGAGTYSGTTIITVSGVDLASPLTIEALVSLGGGVEWDNYGAVWEEGGGGMTVVNVDSIENVYPVWTVVGPTNNPTLENLTTNTTIAYSGNVALGQTLVVDMLNETAKLNGTSVIGNISGKWLEFAPGNNRINYTATNADAPNSTIEWQEIVG